MGKNRIFVGANLDPEFYNKIQKKFPDKSDTELIKEGLTMLLSGNISKEDNDQILDLNRLKPEVWQKFVEKTKERNIKSDKAVGCLIWLWINNKVEI
jgi:hypothetical protein